MSDQFVETFTEKLMLLEQKTGAGVSYRLMTPFETPFYDFASVQDAAKIIAAFIGLTGFTFIVAVNKQKDKVGGHIDLTTRGDAVYIEIDEGVLKFPDVVGATLCHEICHKWLQVHGVGHSLQTENEILTDIATVFLGLGKVMLNGCQGTHVTRETIPNGTRTVTETMTSGYLDRVQLALVYRLVCAMRRTPTQEFMWGLNSEASQCIRVCDKTLGHYYDSRLHLANLTRDSVGQFCDGIVSLQHDMAGLDKKLTYIKKACCETIDGFLGRGHKRLNALHQKAIVMAERTEPDPALNFLMTIDDKFELERMNHEVQTIRQDASALLKHADVLGRRLYQDKDRFPTPTPSMFNIVTCRLDGTKLRFPEQSGDLIATCPTCKYHFPYNTASVTFSMPLLWRIRTFLVRFWRRIRKKRTG